jgi:hypothetical protein
MEKFAVLPYHNIRSGPLPLGWTAGLVSSTLQMNSTKPISIDTLPT